MTSQNKSPATLLRTAIIFAALCFSATAVGAAAPLFVSSFEAADFALRKVEIVEAASTQDAGNLKQEGTNA
jgi:hypothetical protein